MNNKVYKKKALQEVGFTLLIVLIYLVGSSLVVPGVDSQHLLKTVSQSLNLSFGLSMMGISLNNFSLFSLGLAPWMSALIFWQVLTVTKLFNVDNFSEKQIFHIKFVFSLCLGVIQSFTVIHQVQLFGRSSQLPFYVLCPILLAGLSILIWLGELNSQHGLGGQTVIILVTMIRNWPSSLMKELSGLSLNSQTFLMALILLISLMAFLYGVFVFFQGERRLPIKHVLLDEQFSQASYVPISTNTAGGMPFMYAFSIMQLPTYVLFMLKSWLKGNGLLDGLYDQMQLSRPLGVGVLMVTIILLTYGFSYVNVDYKTLAEQMKKTGDYFPRVYPGKNTEKYLFDKITRIATVSALFNGVLIGLPMFLSVFFPRLSTWAYFFPTCIIVLLLMKEIQVQFISVYHLNDYSPILGNKKQKASLFKFFGSHLRK